MDHTILIVDDMEINRVILSEGFKDSYNILEAEDGSSALDYINSRPDISAVLLDLIMPGMGGIEVLEEMRRTGKTSRIPVFIITAANGMELLSRAYELGAVDVISKPFMVQFLRCRIGNVIELYRHRDDLVSIVNEQLEKLHKVNQSMIETLAEIIEFRDAESGEHVKRICGLTEILMTKVSEMFPEHNMTKSEIEKIVSASILHDVGKISVPDNILNKPGRLTPEEFEIMKRHTTSGCEMLAKIPAIMDKDIYDYCYDICRHHHERWDGRGYPDGLAGNDITIWSQVVAVADVYDALTSERVYKAAFDHETAVRMIYNGECGAFNPQVLEAFSQCEKQIRERNAAISKNKNGG